MNQTIYLLLFVFSVQFAISQEIKFGKISKEELMEKSYPEDSTANAAVLYAHRNTYFLANLSGIEIVTEIHKRVKIYNKDGFDYASEEINLFKTDNEKEVIGRIKASTYNLENGKIVETDLDKDQIFETDYSYNYNQVKFTMPNIKEGSVIEFKYKINSPFYSNIDEFVLQEDIPIKEIVAQLQTPRGVNFKPTSKGSFAFYGKNSSSYSGSLGMNMDVKTYSLKNVPALRAESYVNNMDNYRAGVLFELVSINLPGSAPRYFSQSWKDVAERIGNSDDYEDQLDKTKSFDDILDPILVNQTSQVDKMKTLFKYVKDNITWNGIDGKYFYNGIRKTLKEKKGNAADVNLTLVAMLRYAGIDANPLVISTKDNLVPMFPTLDRLNYVIAYASINDESFFLDATDEFSDINLLPLRDYNWKGILVDNHKMRWDNIDINQPESALGQYMINAKLNENGELEGKLKSRYTNHKAYKFRKNFKDQDLDAFIAKREEVFGNVEISEYQTDNTNGYEGHVSESFDFYKENAADIINDKIYLQPLSFLKLTENPFKLDKREFPIDFEYPFANKYIVNISIPEGYTLEFRPEPMAMKIPADLGEFQFLPKVVGNNIQLMVSFQIKQALMSPDTYMFLKEFYNQMINKEAEQIILTKA